MIVIGAAIAAAGAALLFLLAVLGVFAFGRRLVRELYWSWSTGLAPDGETVALSGAALAILLIVLGLLTAGLGGSWK